MDSESALASTSLTEKIVLHAIVELQRRGDDRIDSLAIRDECRGRLPSIEEHVVGDLGEAEVMTALGKLTRRGLVTERPAEARSPVGKGRPGYTLEADEDAVFQALIDDERLVGLVEDHSED